MKKLVAFILAALIPLCLQAQTERTWENLLDNIGQAEDIDNGTLEQLYDQLSEMANNKIDLNTCTREQLEAIPFLSNQQVMDFIEYRDRVGRVETSAELFLVPSFDKTTIDRIREFITFSPAPSGDTIPSLRNILRYGHSNLVADLQIPFYNRAGNINGYLGSKYKHWLRYSYTYRQKLKVGFTASQDAGEPFFSGKNKSGYDFYSFYFLAKDMGWLKTLALGRYRLRFGLGLILNNSFGYGKLITLSNYSSTTSHIFAHSSRSEANYLQGAAATMNITDGLDVTAFVSYRKIDATLNSDSTVATILKTGYHRTESEMNRRRNTAETLAGGNINFFRNGFHAGATGYFTSFDRQLHMNNGQRYRRWYPEGRSFYNLSVDYGYLSGRLTVAGETAIDNNSQIATINTISYKTGDRLTLTALQRYYPYRYQALHAQSFAEGGQTNDESGVFIGGQWDAWRDVTLSFYTDIAYFAWPKYGVSQSSKRWDNLVQLNAARGKWNFMARYRLKMKELDNDSKTGIVTRYEHRARLAATFSNETTLTIRSQADIAFTTEETKSFGFMISENAEWLWRWMKLRASAGWFNTDNYSSRVYNQETGLLYSFMYQSFSGQGMRCALSLRADVSDRLMIIAKAGTTHYFDRDVISSGLQRIDSSWQTDLEMQIKWRF